MSNFDSKTTKEQETEEKVILRNLIFNKKLEKSSNSQSQTLIISNGNLSKETEKLYNGRRDAPKNEILKHCREIFEEKLDPFQVNDYICKKELEEIETNILQETNRKKKLQTNMTNTQEITDSDLMLKESRVLDIQKQSKDFFKSLGDQHNLDKQRAAKKTNLPKASKNSELSFLNQSIMENPDESIPSSGRFAGHSAYISTINLDEVSNSLTFKKIGSKNQSQNYRNELDQSKSMLSADRLLSLRRKQKTYKKEDSLPDNREVSQPSTSILTTSMNGKCQTSDQLRMIDQENENLLTFCPHEDLDHKETLPLDSQTNLQSIPPKLTKDVPVVFRSRQLIRSDTLKDQTDSKNDLIHKIELFRKQPNNSSLQKVPKRHRYKVAHKEVESTSEFSFFYQLPSENLKAGPKFFNEKSQLKKNREKSLPEISEPKKEEEKRFFRKNFFTTEQKSTIHETVKHSPNQTNKSLLRKPIHTGLPKLYSNRSSTCNNVKPDLSSIQETNHQVITCADNQIKDAYNTNPSLKSKENHKSLISLENLIKPVQTNYGHSGNQHENSRYDSVGRRYKLKKYYHNDRSSLNTDLSQLLKSKNKLCSSLILEKQACQNILSNSHDLSENIQEIGHDIDTMISTQNIKNEKVKDLLCVLEKLSYAEPKLLKAIYHYNKAGAIEDKIDQEKLIKEFHEKRQKSYFKKEREEGKVLKARILKALGKNSLGLNSIKGAC